MTPMELSARDRIIIENLQRRLRSQKRDVSEHEVQEVVFNIVLPEIADRDDLMIGIGLINLSGHTVLAEIPNNLINIEYVLQLCKLLTEQSSYRFQIMADHGVLVGYTENAWDWIVVKTSIETVSLIDSLLVDIWCGFYDY